MPNVENTGALKIIRGGLDHINPGAGRILTPESEKADELIEKIRIGGIIGRRILGQKCVNDHIRDDDGNILIYKLDRRLDFSNWVEVHCVGSQNRFLTPELFKQLSEEGHVMMQFLEGGQGITGIGFDLWMADEELMESNRMACCVWIQP